jgi:hypothetical protein
VGSVIAALLREAYLRLTHQSKSASRMGRGPPDPPWAA